MIGNLKKQILISKVTLIVLCTLLISFSVGLTSLAQSMRKTTTDYLNNSKASHLEYSHALGIDVEMINALEGLTGHQAKGVIEDYGFAALTRGDLVVRMFAYSDVTALDLNLKAGRLPEKEAEAFVDEQMMERQGLNIGDTIQFKGTTIFSTTTLTIVGVGSSNLYLNDSRGNSSLGSGDVEGFIYALTPPKNANIYTTVRFETSDATALTQAIKSGDETISEGRFTRIHQPRLDELTTIYQGLENEKESAIAGLNQERYRLESMQLNLQDAHSEMESAINEMAGTLGLEFGAQSLELKLETLKRVGGDTYSNTLISLETKRLEHESEISTLETLVASKREDINNTTDPDLLITLNQELEMLLKDLAEKTTDLEDVTVEIVELQEDIDGFNLDTGRIELGIETYESNLKQYQSQYTRYLSSRDATTADYDKQLREIENEMNHIQTLEYGLGDIQAQDQFVEGYHDSMLESDSVERVGLNAPLLLLLLITVVAYSYFRRRNVLSLKESQKVAHRPLPDTLVIFGISFTIGTILGFFIIPNFLYDNYLNVYHMPDLIHVYSIKNVFKSSLVVLLSLSMAYGIHRLLPKWDLKPRRKGLWFERFIKVWPKLSVSTRLKIRFLNSHKLKFFLWAMLLAIVLSVFNATVLYHKELKHVNAKQVDEITHYDAIQYLSDTNDLSNEEGTTQLGITLKNVNVSGNFTSLFVLNNDEDIDLWVSLLDAKSGKPIILGNTGISLPINLSKTLGIGVGDSLTLHLDGSLETFVIKSVHKQYLGSTIYMSSNAYVQAVGKPLVTNAVLLKDANFDLKTHDDILTQESVSAVRSVRYLYSRYDREIESHKNLIMYPIGISAMALLVIANLLYESLFLNTRKNLDIYLRLGFSDKKYRLDNFSIGCVVIFFASCISLILTNFIYHELIALVASPSIYLGDGLGWGALCISVLVGFLMTAGALYINTNRKIS